MKSRKLWVGIPLSLLVFTVMLVGCDLFDFTGETNQLVGKWYRDPTDKDNGIKEAFEFLSNGNLRIPGSSAGSFKDYAYKSTSTSITITVQGSNTETTNYTATSTTLDIQKKCGPIAKRKYYRAADDSGGSTPVTPNPPDSTYVEMPDADPFGGEYTAGQTVTVTLTNYTSGADIFYTTTGTDPTADSARYISPIPISATVALEITLKAIAIKGSYKSDVMEAKYIFKSTGTTPTPPTVATPAATPEAGTYTGTKTVTLSCATEGAKIYFTKDGTDPTPSSTEYTNTTTISVTTGTTTIKAIAIKDGASSSILTAIYTISAPAQDAITVSNGNNSGAGSLRQALADIKDGGTITINSSVTTITLTGATGWLVINKNVTIEGNGVIITKGTGFPSSGHSLIENGTNENGGKTVNIRRVHFKQGSDSGTPPNAGNGAAIYNYTKGSLALESCIFTLNTTSRGGALFNEGTASATVRGCTFYNNSVTGTGNVAGRGGAIYNERGTLALVGNIFYMNTASIAGPIVYKGGTGSIRSDGYNLVDKPLGTGDDQCGWEAGTGDKTLTGAGLAAGVAPINTTTFAPVITLNNFMPSYPSQFPTTDFKGNTRTNKTPGAVDY